MDGLGERTVKQPTDSRGPSLPTNIMNYLRPTCSPAINGQLRTIRIHLLPNAARVWARFDLQPIFGRPAGSAPKHALLLGVDTVLKLANIPYARAYQLRAARNAGRVVQSVRPLATLNKNIPPKRSPWN